MKKLFLFFIVFTLLLILSIAGLGLKIKNDLLVAINDNSKKAIIFEVQAGSTVPATIKNLKEKGLIKNEYWVNIFAKITDLELKSGVFELSPSMNAITILQKIESGDVIDERVTTIEGWRSEEIGRKLINSKLLNNIKDFKNALQSKNWPELNKYKLNPEDSIEGFLFPDTYQFAPNSTIETILGKMVDNFILKTSALNITYDDLILASIIEREALHDKDRAKIAGVYFNRIKIGMKLDADPTVQFGKANDIQSECFLDNTNYKLCLDYNYWPKLVKSDYRSINSPWNTYIKAGLPPSPISNPGIASIKAVINPENHDFYFFITDKDGFAHFAKNLIEHEENIKKFIGK